MTAIPGDGNLNPEENAESAAHDVYQWYLLRRAAVITLFVIGGAFFMAADWAFGVLALWHVPPWAVGLLVAFMAAEVAILVMQYRAEPQKPRARRPGLSRGENLDAFLDELPSRRAKFEPLPPWRKRVRTFRFWRKLVVRVFYAGCAALVLTAWLGLIAGLIGVALFEACGFCLRESVYRRKMLNILNAVAFADHRPPRDSPEM